MKRKIIKSAVAVLIASSIVTAVGAQYHMENTMNKNGLTEVKEFILSLPADKQDAMATLHETHRNEMKTLLDSYKDVEKTETIQTEIEAKMKELHTKHLAEVKALLLGVEGADEIIAKMEEKHETMMNMPDKMDMMSGSGKMDMSHMMMKGKMQEDNAFIESLSEEMQTALKDLKDTHHADIKTLLDSYKDVEKTETIHAEIEAKLVTLHTSYVVKLKALLVGVEGAEEFIAEVESKKPSDMMGDKMNMGTHKGMMVNKGKMGDMKKRDNAKKVMAHKAKYDKKIGKTLAKVTDDTLLKLLTKLDQISEKIQLDASFTDTMKNDYLDKIEALRDIITAEIGN